MNWWVIFQFALGMGLCCWMSHSIDCHDDRAGRRPGACADGYGSNVSYTWRNVLATLGFLSALAAPIIR
jgi:hypothetical protein